MKHFPIFAFCFAAIAFASTAQASLLLRSDFNNEPLNTNIATGGAALGEPISVDISGMAQVVQSSFVTPSLEITDLSTLGANFVTFEFLNSAEITTGKLKVSFSLRFAQLGNYEIGVREQGGAAQDYYDLLFTDTGFYVVPFASAQTYDTTSPLAFEIVFDLDARTVDTSVNGSALVTAAPMGGSSSRGIGRLFFGNNFDSDTNGNYDLDDLIVTTPGDTIFVDGFDFP
jgi:hypothetical protein